MPLGWLISLHRAISYIYLWRSQDSQLTRQELSLHNLRKLKKLPTGSRWLQFMLYFLPFSGFFPLVVQQHKQGPDPTAYNRNCATTMIECLHGDLTQHQHVSKYIPLNTCSSEDQLAQQCTSPPPIFHRSWAFSCTLPGSIMQQWNWPQHTELRYEGAGTWGNGNYNLWSEQSF